MQRAAKVYPIREKPNIILDLFSITLHIPKPPYAFPYNIYR